MAAAEIGQFERIAGEYRKAFDEVQRLLAASELGKVPSYVFAIDRFDVKKLGELNPELARAEQRRRQWRAALHAMAELEALQPDMPTADADAALSTLDAENPMDSMSNPSGGMVGLDRFISVVQYARTTGCMYVNGGFEPVFKGSKH